MPVPNVLAVDWEKEETQQAFKEYTQAYIRGRSEPYALQQPQSSWRTIHKPVSDPLVKYHLEQKYWIGVSASWYPFNFILDFDKPKDQVVDKVHERLRLSSGQYLLMTSPSYKATGNVHLALRLEYREQPTTHKLGYNTLRDLVGDLCEVYPQRRRKFRLPFGRDQFIISPSQQVLDQMDWIKSFYWLNKLDPLPLESLQGQEPLALDVPPLAIDNPRNWPTAHQSLELYEHGLQGPHSRHQGQWAVALLLFRRNWLPHEAISELKRWIRTRHNGFSEEVNQGKWREIDAEIERQVRWIWGNCERFPDATHNLQGFVTKEDLEWIVRIFPGDVVNQKRLFNLVCYYRPRAHHGFVFIPQRVWCGEIANNRTYKDFITALEQRRLLQSIKAYRHVPNHPEFSYSRKFKLNLPPVRSEPLLHDGRNLQDYYEAMFSLSKSKRELAQFTGVARQRFYDANLRHINI